MLQRGMDGTQDFYLYWDDYVREFGDLKGEFWLGLSKLHHLTASNPMANTAELRVDLADSKYMLTTARSRLGLLTQSIG